MVNSEDEVIAIFNAGREYQRRLSSDRLAELWPRMSPRTRAIIREVDVGSGTEGQIARIPA